VNIIGRSQRVTARPGTSSLLLPGQYFLLLEINYMPKKRSAVEQRREQIIAQVDRLRRQLASKTRKDYTSDYCYERWLKQSHDLIDELLGELSALEEPGEYDELPVAIIADELGLRLDQVRQMIKLGEIEAAGRRAHERVCRVELERLTEMGTNEILSRFSQTVEAIFDEAVSQLRSGDLEACDRSYRRLKARQSCIGNRALAAEVAIKLTKGMYEEVERLIRFILNEKLHDSVVIGTYLADFVRDVCFKNQGARAEILRLLTPILDDEVRGAVQARKVADDLQLTAMCVATIVIEGMEELVGRSLLADRRDELYGLIKDRVFSALYAEANLSASIKNRMFILSTKQRLPSYWKRAELLDELHED
jgi:hypothetical protein